MSIKIWISANEFINVNNSPRSLTQEIATRARSMDFTTIGMLLPDPDPVLRKLNQDIQVYRELLSDAHVDSVVQSRQSGVSCNEWDIEPADTSRAAKKAAAICDDALQQLDMMRIIEETLEAVLFGYAVLEVIWERRDGLVMPADVVGKRQEWFGFDDENRLRFKSRDSGWTGELLPEKKFIVVQNRASYFNPYGERMLARCFWPVTFKRGGLKFWVMFTEKYGMPFLVGEYQPGASQPEQDLLLSALENMVRDAVAVIPNNGSVKILEAQKSASAEIYRMLVDTCNAEISKAGLGQTLTTEMSEKGGAFAASKTHQEVRQDLVNRDKRKVIQTIRTLNEWILDLNLPGAPVPGFVWHAPEDVRLDMAERDELLSKQGVKFTPAHYINNYNLEEDEFVVGPAPGPPPGLPGQTQPGYSSVLNTPVQFAEMPPARLEMGALAKKSADAAAPELKKITALVVNRLKNATSFQDIPELTRQLYPELKMDQLADRLGLARFEVNALGREGRSRQLNFAVTGDRLTPEAALEYLRSKGLKTSWNWWDVWQAEHTQAFTVAHCMKLDLFQDIRDAVDDAIANGTTFEDFKDNLIPILRSKGWWGRVEEVSPKTGLIEEYTAGTPSRLWRIYDTNLNVAYSAGQYAADMENIDVAPNWMYCALPTACPECVSLDGKVFPATDPFWDTFYPSIHWGCNCWVIPLSDNQTREMNKPVESGTDSNGNLLPQYQGIVQPEWAFNPAKAAWTPDLSKYDQDLADLYRGEVNE